MLCKERLSCCLLLRPDMTSYLLFHSPKLPLFAYFHLKPQIVLLCLGLSSCSFPPHHELWLVC